MARKLRTVSEKHFERYFDYARERYLILLRRRAGQPAPWTDDPVLQKYRFTNISREDDRTTEWLRENIRDPMRHSPAVMMAVIAFRAFNRVETGELIKDDILAECYDFPRWKKVLEERKAAGFPCVTGAYIIKTPPNMTKIDGVLWQLQQAKLREPQLLQWLRETPKNQRSQQSLWNILCDFPYMGQFNSAEVICDLVHTDILETATDLMTWTNPGPGCAAGIGLLLHGDETVYRRGVKEDREVMIDIMKLFLKASQNQKYWPQDWPKWNLHSCEFAFCELKKYLLGQAGRKLKRCYK